MLEIAGGILIAVAVLLALPYILAGAYFAVSFGIAIGIAIGVWFVLASVVGTGWAWTISIAAAITWLGWSGWQEEKEKQAEEALKAVKSPQESKRDLYKKLLREGYVYHTDVNGRKRIQDLLDSEGF
jgi:membrane protein implicated in regulation of membrane protease activity